MKILLNLLAASAAGQVSRTEAFLERFESLNSDAKLIVVKDKASFLTLKDSERIKYLNVPLKAGRLKLFHRLLWENVFLSRVLQEQRIDVFLTFSHYLPVSGLSGVPSVVGVSNLAPFFPETWEGESLLQRMRLRILKSTILGSCNKATQALALSQTCKEILIAGGIDSKKISVTPNGVDIFWSMSGPESNLLQRLGVRMPFLLCVSHFYSYKNFSRLVEAFSRLPDAIRTNHQLVIIGKPFDRSYYDAVQKIIAKRQISDLVLVIPGETRENLRLFYQATKLFVFPSLIENSPNIVLEAMMSGAPLAMGKQDPMPEFGGNAAAYFDPTSIDSITETLEKLLNDPEGLERMRTLSKEQAALFSWDTFVMSVNEVCQAASRHLTYQAEPLHETIKV